MTPPSHSQALASSLHRENSFSALLQAYESLLLASNLHLFPTILLDLEMFIKRNRILGSQAVLEEDLCPRCIKAHLLAIARRESLPAAHVQQLAALLPGDNGHDGYYLDHEEVKKVWSGA